MKVKLGKRMGWCAGTVSIFLIVLALAVGLTGCGSTPEPDAPLPYALSVHSTAGGWLDIVQVTAGYYHTVGLKSDGSVVAVGLNTDGECDVEAWNLS